MEVRAPAPEPVAEPEGEHDHPVWWVYGRDIESAVEATERNLGRRPDTELAASIADETARIIRDRVSPNIAQATALLAERDAEIERLRGELDAGTRAAIRTATKLQQERDDTRVLLDDAKETVAEQVRRIRELEAREVTGELLCEVFTAWSREYADRAADRLNAALRKEQNDG